MPPSDPSEFEDALTDVDEIRDILLDQDTLISRISEVISEILDQKIMNSRDELARSFGPVISESIRHQVYHSRSDIIDALHPVMGDLINKAVREAIRNLAQNIDNRVRQDANPINIGRRFKAQYIEGIPASEYRLREALPYVVQEVFLIHRESGLLIHHFSRDPDNAEDRDLVSGMLTAIRDFAREAFGRGSSGELGSIEYESKNIILEAGGAAYLAVVIDGTEPQGFREQMRAVLFSLHKQHYESLKEFDGGDEKLNETAKSVIVSSFQQESDQKKATKPLNPFQRTILFTLAVLLIVMLCLPIQLCGLWMWRVESTLTALANSTPQTIMLPVTVVPTIEPSATPTHTPSPVPTKPLPTVTPVPPTPTPTTEVIAPTNTPFTPLVKIGGIVSAQSLYLRAKPVLTSDILLTLSLGDEITGIARDSESVWICVTTWSGISGWVYGPYVKWDGDITMLGDQH
ncbi:SH3 domain-containing protein [Anaerolineales bacterium HSG6]|nr:SH3 domain-containing protein [Anaerolineales bacterium HSG6]